MKRTRKMIQHAKKADSPARNGGRGLKQLRDGTIPQTGQIRPPEMEGVD